MKTKRFLGVISLLLCTFLSFDPNIQLLARIPDFWSGTQLNVPEVSGIWSRLIKVEQEPVTKAMASKGNAAPITVQISYKLFGIFPIKSSEVDVMPPMSLIPGGQSIGVTLQAKGVMVVGQAPIQGQDGKKYYPAKEAGIEIGDTLIKIGDKEVQTDQDVANAVNQAGEKQGSIKVLLKHRGEILERALKAIYCPETERYRIGLYVRDAAAGVGTLTFIDPLTKRYGALGHVISDADTNQRIEVSRGQIVASNIYSVEKGRRGHPGEKIGSFVSNSAFSGSIEKNTPTGIFGTLQGALENPYFSQAIPVGWESDIQEGPAKIYTVIQGERIEEYEVQIERIMPNRTDSKNMVLRITDPRLIQATGGIVQGMSGSPIVQNGKLIGAVTHVFVNDSLRGYGVFIQNMIHDSGLLEKNQAA
ncbi:MAG: SpoIVB peptidase [Desulfitobacteriaceae bacterium]